MCVYVSVDKVWFVRLDFGFHWMDLHSVYSSFFRKAICTDIEHVIRLIPGRYEEEYIDKSIANCALCSFIYRLPSTNIRIHARYRSSLAISLANVACVRFALRHTPIKIDVDIYRHGTAIATLCFVILFKYVLFLLTFNDLRVQSRRYVQFSDKLHASILIRLISFLLMISHACKCAQCNQEWMNKRKIKLLCHTSLKILTRNMCRP